MASIRGFTMGTWLDCQKAVFPFQLNFGIAQLLMEGAEEATRWGGRHPSSSASMCYNSERPLI